MRTPWHIWLVGIIALIWYGIAAADYVMTQYQYEPYLALLSEAQMSYVNGIPTWVEGTWAAAIWLSVAGAFFLLIKSRFSPLMFGLAPFFFVVATVYLFGFAGTKPMDVFGQNAIFAAVAVLVVAMVMWVYTRVMRQHGHLE